jgi:nickel superoxide dismutase
MIAILLLTLAGTIAAQAHCQVPCGIYDDQMRIHLMEEHVTTIEKAMKQIEEGPNANQTTRWVLNKEKHAEELDDIVTYYFMTQRIKPGMKNYEQNLKTLHEILIESMKCKQTTDLVHVEKLKELIHNFEHTYMGDKHHH